MPTPRFSHSAVVRDTFVYVIAGNTGKTISGAVERYDVNLDNWISLKSKTTAVSEISAVVIGGKIYVPGGRLQSGSISDVLEVYDIQYDYWSQKARMPKPLCAYALTAFEGQMFLFGGWDGKKSTKEVYRYDPILDKWIELTELPSARDHASAAVAGNQIYIFGGVIDQRPLAENLVYRPDYEESSENPWSKASPMPQDRFRMGVVSIADIILVFGGISEDEVLPELISYFYVSDTWQEFENLEHLNITGSAVVGVGNFILAIGGQTMDGKPTGINRSYQAVYTLSLPIIR